MPHRDLENADLIPELFRKIFKGSRLFGISSSNAAHVRVIAVAKIFALLRCLYVLLEIGDLLRKAFRAGGLGILKIHKRNGYLFKFLPERFCDRMKHFHFGEVDFFRRWRAFGGKYRGFQARLSQDDQSVTGGYSRLQGLPRPFVLGFIGFRFAVKRDESPVFRIERIKSQLEFSPFFSCFGDRFNNFPHILFLKIRIALFSDRIADGLFEHDGIDGSVPA